MWFLAPEEETAEGFLEMKLGTSLQLQTYMHLLESCLSRGKYLSRRNQYVG